MLRCCAPLLLLLLCASSVLSAQATSGPSPAAACQLPVVANLPAGASIFNDQQEEELAAIVAAQLETHYPVVNDETTAYLQSLGDRLLAGAPDNKLHFRFVLLDMPVNNAFSIGGGRVYVSRKLIAFTHNEDELAGILGHEIGHVLAHHMAIEISMGFREVLGVTSVGDKKDIFEKWGRFVDNLNRKPKAFQHSDKQEEREQQVADRIGMYLMARAGYNPAASVEAFDRLAGLKGNTGNFFSDLFGTTSADSKRLRELLKTQNASMPATCVAAHAANEAEYQAWQKKVIENRPLVGEERLAGVVTKVALQPALRSDIKTIRFSPDGKYILAQDDANIAVLTREPFANYLHIDAPDALPAAFGPDGKTLSFITDEMRVETWDLETKKRTLARELNITGCGQRLLSPKGDYLMCVLLEDNFALSVAVYDVATEKAVFTKKNFFGARNIIEMIEVSFLSQLGAEGIFVHAAYSPDGRYLLVGRTNGGAFGYDLQNRSEMKMSGKIKEAASYAVTFLGPDRIVGVNPYAPTKSRMLTFPAGQELGELPLGLINLEAATKGDYLMVRPMRDFPVGLYDVAQKRLIMGLKTPAMDVFGTDMVAERINGELGLYTIGTPAARAAVPLPNGSLGAMRARVFSPDLSFVALSEKSRGAIWKMQTGERVQHIRGFRGSYFDGTELVADVAKFDKTERTMVNLQTAQQTAQALYKPEQKQLVQLGDITVSLLPISDKDTGYVRANAIFEVRDAKTAKLLWTRSFEKAVPEYFRIEDSGHMTMIYYDYDSMKLEAANDATLAAKLADMKDRKQAYLVQTIEARTGKKLGTFIVDTGNLSFKVRSAASAGGQVLVSDNQNRVNSYDLHTGEVRARAFGRLRAVSESGHLMLVENQEGDCTVYDTVTGAERAQLTFPTTVAAAQFNSAGDMLGVVTADQHAYKIDVPKAIAAATAPEAAGIAAR